MKNPKFEKRFEGLLERILEPGLVVPFLGAGVSVGCRLAKTPESSDPSGVTSPSGEDFEPSTKYLAKKLRERLEQVTDFTWPCRDEGEASSFSTLAEILGWSLPRTEVLETIQIELFAELTPLAAHAYIAYLAREGLIDLVFTTNWDTCLEKAYTATFLAEDRRMLSGNARRTRRWPKTLAVIDDLDSFQEKGGQASRTGSPCLRIVKINGCSGRYVDHQDESEAERIRLTDLDLQRFWADPWAHDLLLTVARSRSLLFSGFGSDEPQVRHTILKMKVAELSGKGKDSAHFVQEHEKELSFNQAQILLTSGRGASNPHWQQHAFTGSDRTHFEPERADSEGDTEKLPADRFWRRLFQAAFGRLLRQQTSAWEPFGQWVRSHLAEAPGELLAQMVDWYYPSARSGATGRQVFDSLFGRYHRMLEPPRPGHGPGNESGVGEAGERCWAGGREEPTTQEPAASGSWEPPLLLSTWLGAMMGHPFGWAGKGASPTGWAGRHPYIPLREEPLLVGGLLLFLFMAFRDRAQPASGGGRESPKKVVPTRWGLEVTVDGSRVYLVSEEWLPTSRRELEQSTPGQLLMQVVLPAQRTRGLRSLCDLQYMAGDARPRVCRPIRLERVSLATLLRRGGLAPSVDHFVRQAAAAERPRSVLRLQPISTPQGLRGDVP